MGHSHRPPLRSSHVPGWVPRLPVHLSFLKGADDGSRSFLKLIALLHMTPRTAASFGSPEAGGRALGRVF